MLPRLRAEESLIESERLRVGSGTLKRGAALDVTRRWQREAQGPTRRAVKVPPQQLVALGIGYTVVESRYGQHHPSNGREPADA